MDLLIEIDGLAELDRKLSQFPEKLQRKMLNRALRAGAKIAQGHAKAAAPIRTGRLRKEIVVRSAAKRGAAARISVGLRGKSRRYADDRANRRLGRVGQRYLRIGDAFYGRFIETGVKPHKISTAKKLLTDGSDIFGRVVQHPGVQPRPFLRPALENHTHEILSAVRGSLAAQIEAETGG